MDIFTSRLIFSGSLSRFLELMGVIGSGDCGVLRQQLPVQHASRVPQEAGENRGETCVSDGRTSEQLVAHLRAGSRQRAGWRYRRGPSYHLQLPDPRETPCSAGGGEETDRCSFDTSLGVREAVRDPSREDSVVAKHRRDGV